MKKCGEIELEASDFSDFDDMDDDSDSDADMPGVQGYWNTGDSAML